jgi:hypothetical protein
MAQTWGVDLRTLVAPLQNSIDYINRTLPYLLSYTYYNWTNCAMFLEGYTHLQACKKVIACRKSWVYPLQTYTQESVRIDLYY